MNIESRIIRVCKCGSIGADDGRGGATRCGRNGSTNMWLASCPITRHRVTLVMDEPSDLGPPDEPRDDYNPNCEIRQ